MKLKNLLPIIAVVLGCAGQAAETKAPPAAADKIVWSRKMAAFLDGKEAHARALEGKFGLKLDKEFWTYLSQARAGDWRGADATFDRLKERAGWNGGPPNTNIMNAAWQVLNEVSCVMWAFCPTNGAGKFATAFGEGVVASIPAGSIYIGGTDTGRGLPTAFSKSHADGNPFFTITQNQLADGTYLKYLEATYGKKIYVPSNEDSQRSFSEYLEDAQKRLKHDTDFPNEPRQIRPGEDVKTVDNRVQVSGQVAVMAINGLLTKIIFDQNPKRDFYVEESFPLDWMYPYLAPHGLIFHLNREPLATLTPEMVAKDREFWTKKMGELLGTGMTYETPVKEVCALVERIHLQKDLKGFTGDAAFVRSDYAMKMYAKLRSSLGGLYQWRATSAKNPEEKERMMKEGDFAFRQSFALCPWSPESIFRYVNLLVQQARVDEALLIGRTAAKLDPANGQLKNLISELERMKRAAKP